MFLSLRDIHCIWKYLSVAKTPAHAFVTSRLDYCNSLLFNIADKDLNWLQRIQNCLARIVTRSPPRTRSIPLLHRLHWLPMKFRIQFKINLLTFKALSMSQPSYLHNLLTVSTSRQSECKGGGTLLCIPRVKTNTGARAFSSCAPTLSWVCAVPPQFAHSGSD